MALIKGKLSEDAQTVYDLLPASGEITHEEWRTQALASGVSDPAGQLRYLFTSGLLKRRLTMTEDKQPVLYVSRKEG